MTLAGALPDNCIAAGVVVCVTSVKTSAVSNSNYPFPNLMETHDE
jgi:hypothetical protein